MSMKMKFGSKDIPFVYKGDKLVYPNPIKDGLLLWYGFKGMRNTDTNKEIAKDLSGNGNDGTLTNFNFTEGSGYKDNTLVFDGVDDRLTIPELVLDETAMTVKHDGKLYAYEDDKVMTVGEDGEIIGNGKNLIKNSNKQVENSDYSLAHYYWSSAEDVVPGEKYTIVVKGYLSSPEQNGWYINTYGKTEEGVSTYPRVSTLLEEDKVSDNTWVKTVTIPSSLKNPTGRSTLYSNLPGNGFSSKVIHFAIYKGEEIEIVDSLAPEDYQATTLSPTSLTDLQLYNKTLNKTELLHNAESKGLKKLKPGVVVQDGLLLHYDFSHESNTSEYKGKAFDYSGNGNHGELQNFNFTEESGYVGNKLKFDGVDDMIIVNDIVENFPIIEDFAIQIVYKRNTYTGTTVIFGNRAGVFEGAGGLGIELRSNSNGYLFYIDDGENYVSNLVPYENGQHGLITLTRKNGWVSTYINGNLERESDLSEVGNILVKRELFIGSRPTGNLYKDDGELSSFKIYNRALTPEEIKHNCQIEKEKFNIVEGEM